ncbi:hypothetical protein O181_056657, partial [Austropuccinia psidii MF-1]|nr:hypothetical protein [Austropuccinia psidii MF-1]
PLCQNCTKARKKVYDIKKVPEEESQTEDYESDSMGDAIREQSDEEQGPREEFIVEYQEETPPEIQEIQLEAGMPQDTANKNLCKHTQDAQKFLATPTKGMEYIHGTATKVTVCIDNSQHPLIIDSGATSPQWPEIIWKTTSQIAKNNSFQTRQRTSKVLEAKFLPLGQLSKK